jgi:hypothetical protein
LRFFFCCCCCGSCCCSTSPGTSAQRTEHRQPPRVLERLHGMRRAWRPQPTLPRRLGLLLQLLYMFYRCRHAAAARSAAAARAGEPRTAPW